MRTVAVTLVKRATEICRFYTARQLSSPSLSADFELYATQQYINLGQFTPPTVNSPPTLEAERWDVSRISFFRTRETKMDAAAAHLSVPVCGTAQEREERCRQARSEICPDPGPGTIGRRVEPTSVNFGTDMAAVLPN